jgi:hypothetical protein
MGGMNLIHLAAGMDFGTIFWFVVIAVFVISQIVKSRKQFDESAPDQQKPPDTAGDPAEELRKFLEGLSKAPEQPQQQPQAPAAPPPQAQQRRVVPPKHKPREARRVFAPAAVSAVRAAPPPKPEAVPAPDEAAVLARYRAEMAATVGHPVRIASKWQAILQPEMRGADRRQPLRKAFVLREILGPPTALRRREVAYPLV